jgi:hypothetical protein
MASKHLQTFSIFSYIVSYMMDVENYFKQMNTTKIVSASATRVIKKGAITKGIGCE